MEPEAEPPKIPSDNDRIRIRLIERGNKRKRERERVVVRVGSLMLMMMMRGWLIHSEHNNQTLFRAAFNLFSAATGRDRDSGATD